MAKTDDQRMKKALEMLHAIEDKDAADEVVSVLNELAPDYARATVAYAFGDTYARTRQLALRDRVLALSRGAETSTGLGRTLWLTSPRPMRGEI